MSLYAWVKGYFIVSLIDYTVAEARKETGSDDAMDHTEGPVVSVKACQVQRP